MSADHWILALLSFVTVIYLAWSAGRLRATMAQDREAILQALRPIQEANERIALMVRELHNR